MRKIELVSKTSSKTILGPAGKPHTKNMKKQRCYWVYILQCRDGSFYIGVTNNIDRRLSEHNSGKSNDSYTSTRLPVVLVHAHAFKYVQDAIAWEKQIKGWSRKKKEALIKGELDTLPVLSKKNFKERRK